MSRYKNLRKNSIVGFIYEFDIQISIELISLQRAIKIRRVFLLEKASYFKNVRYIQKTSLAKNPG